MFFSLKFRKVLPDAVAYPKRGLTWAWNFFFATLHLMEKISNLGVVDKNVVQCGQLDTLSFALMGKHVKQTKTLA